MSYLQLKEDFSFFKDMEPEKIVEVGFRAHVMLTEDGQMSPNGVYYFRLILVPVEEEENGSKVPLSDTDGREKISALAINYSSVYFFAKYYYESGKSYTFKAGTFKTQARDPGNRSWSTMPFDLYFTEADTAVRMSRFMGYLDEEPRKFWKAEKDDSSAKIGGPSQQKNQGWSPWNSKVLVHPSIFWKPEVEEEDKEDSTTRVHGIMSWDSVISGKWDHLTRMG